MNKDITSREDVRLIITDFYEKLIADKEMLPFFKQILDEDMLEHHLEIIIDFWEDLLFQTHKYHNNPMQKHLDFHQKMKFERKHFKLWLQYLFLTIDAQFEGENAHIMKTRATSIATVMQTKMNLFSN